MNWINVALLASVAVMAALFIYLLWFMAHPRTSEQAEEEARRAAEAQQKREATARELASAEPDVGGGPAVDCLDAQGQRRSGGSI